MKKYEKLTEDEKKAIANFEKSKEIKNYLETYVNTSSKTTNKAQLKEFFCFIKTSPEKYLKDIRLIFDREEAAKYIIKIEKNIKDYRIYLNKEAVSKTERKFSPLYIKNCISSLKSLLDSYNIILSDHFWKIIKNGNNSEISIKRTPEPKDIAKILHHADSRGKALALVQATGGNRVGETISISKLDLDLEHEYPRYIIYYDESKTGNNAKKRMSTEAKEAVIEYMKEWEKHFRTTLKRNKYKENLNEEQIEDLIKKEDRLFPISKKEANTIWTNILERAGKPYNEKDPNTNRYVYGSHCLRRFFQNEFDRYDANVTKFFMNHETQVTKAYRSWSEQRIDEEYSKGVKHLLIYKKPIDTDIAVKNLKETNKKLEGKLKVTTDKLELIENRNKEYEQRFNKLEQSIKANNDEADNIEHNMIKYLVKHDLTPQDINTKGNTAKNIIEMITGKTGKEAEEERQKIKKTITKIEQNKKEIHKQFEDKYQQYKRKKLQEIK